MCNGQAHSPTPVSSARRRFHQVDNLCVLKQTLDVRIENTMPRALLSVPAGRCIRRSPEEKWVDPQPDKGLLEMLVEDDLMHLCE